MRIDIKDVIAHHKLMDIKKIVNDLLKSDDYDTYSLAKKVNVNQSTISRLSLGESKTCRSDTAFRLKDLHDALENI